MSNASYHKTALSTTSKKHVIQQRCHGNGPSTLYKMDSLVDTAGFVSAFAGVITQLVLRVNISDRFTLFYCSKPQNIISNYIFLNSNQSSISPRKQPVLFSVITCASNYFIFHCKTKTTFTWRSRLTVICILLTFSAPIEKKAAHTKKQ